MKSKVALLECRSYERKMIKESLSRLADLTDFPKLQGKTVLLKPNLLSASIPEKAVTTHPEFLRAVVDLVKSQNPAKILVGDSPGIGNPETAAKKAGLFQVCEEAGVSWRNFSETKSINSEDITMHNQFLLATEVEEADVIISLPKLKTHSMMYFTGALKNLFGLLPGLNKSGFHMRYPRKSDFAQMIVDLNLAVNADYAIMDGVIAMEGQGPGNGDPRSMNVILGSSDLLALDITASNLIGYDGPSLPIHKAALESPRWINSVEEIALTGDDFESLVCKDFKTIAQVSEYIGMVPNFSLKFFKNLLVPRPVFDHKTCIKCGKCIEICPPKALSFVAKKKSKQVAIDYEKCIRCYCCDEVCPVSAIHLKRRF